MSKLVQPLLAVAAVVVNVIPGIGQVASIAITAGLVAAGAGIQALTAPKLKATPLGNLDRLNASINPSAPRKIVFGRTAMGVDIRYVEPSGENQEYLDYIIAVAAHRINAFHELWIDDKLAWTGTGGVPGAYAPYLTVQPVTEGSASNTIAINGGGKWGANDRLTGCAYLHLRIKRTGQDKKATSPFSGGLSSRLTIIGQGALVYDPRLDSTVPGGSGPQRADDQSTWTFNDAENTALQALWYLLGWRINGKLSVGRGIPPARIDLPSFIEAANLCGEQVGRSAGGTEARYNTDLVVTEADEPSSVLSVLATSCNGRFRDANGKLSLAIMHNDLAIAATDAGLGDDDMLGGFSWDSDLSLEQSYNVVRGQWCDPSPNSLYQQVDYPEVRLPSPDGIDRVLTLNLPAVESASRAQRIAKQALERKQYQRTLTQTFTAVAWRYKVGDVVPVTMAALGFDRKLFRVQQQTITMDGTCPMVLTEENAAIYAWDNSDAPPVTAADPTRYDPLNSPIILGIADAAKTAQWTAVADNDPDHPKPHDGADVTADVFKGLNAGRSPQQVLDDLDLGQLNILGQAVQLGQYKVAFDQLLYDSDGNAVGVTIAAIQTMLDGQQAIYAQLVRTDGGVFRVIQTVDVNGVVTGNEIINNGKVGENWTYADIWGLVQRVDGKVIKPFVVENGIAYFDHIKVRELDSNTAVVVAGADSTAPVAGASTSITSVPPQSPVLTTVVSMKAPGWIYLNAKWRQGYSNAPGSAPYFGKITCEGKEVPASYSDGAGYQDNVPSVGRYYVDSARDVVVQLHWGGHQSITLYGRTLVAIGANFTVL